MALEREKEYVICIDNIASRRFIVIQDSTSVGIPTTVCDLYALTIGKRYELLGTPSNILLINDNGDRKSYSERLFKKLNKSELREYKINSLLSKKK